MGPDYTLALSLLDPKGCVGKEEMKSETCKEGLCTPMKCSSHWAKLPVLMTQFGRVSFL